MNSKNNFFLIKCSTFKIFLIDFIIQIIGSTAFTGMNETMLVNVKKIQNLIHWYGLRKAVWNPYINNTPYYLGVVKLLHIFILSSK